MRRLPIFAFCLIAAAGFLNACTGKKPEFIYKQLPPVAAPVAEVLPGVNLKGSPLEIHASLSRTGYALTIPDDYIMAFYFPAKNQALTGPLAEIAAMAKKDPNRDLGYRCGHASDVHLCRAFTHWYNALQQYDFTKQDLPDPFTFALQEPKDPAHENYINLTTNYLRLNPSSYYEGEWPYYEITFLGQKRKFRVGQRMNKDSDGQITAPKNIGILYQKKKLPSKRTSGEVLDLLKSERSAVSSVLGEGKQIASDDGLRGMAVWRIKDKIVRLAWQSKRSDNEFHSGWVLLSIEGYDEAEPQDSREYLIKAMQGVFPGDIELHK